MTLKRLLCTFGWHDWNKCLCLRCGKVRDKDHRVDQCICKTCRSQIHNFVELDDEMHSCKYCSIQIKHEIEYFSEVREVPGMWTSDIPYFVQDVSGHRCRGCNYERVESTGPPH
jgi:hypothetical protein